MSQIRQAESKAEIVGILKEKDLKIEPTKRESSMVNAIRGQIVVATDETTEHIIKVFSYETTAKGEPNKSFASIKMMMEQFASMADVGNRQDADIIEVKGCQVVANEYYNQGGVLVARPELKASFFSRVADKANAKLIAKFDVEVFFTGFKPETVKGDETGRTLVNAILPMYEGKCAPIQFIAEGAVASYLDSNYEKNKSGRVWGEIINRVIKNVKVIEGFGETKEETNTTYVNELIIKGGSPEQYDPENEKLSWNKADIEKAMVDRELRLEEAKAKAQSGGNKATTKASGAGRPSF